PQSAKRQLPGPDRRGVMTFAPRIAPELALNDARALTSDGLGGGVMERTFYCHLVRRGAYTRLAGGRSREDAHGRPPALPLLLELQARHVDQVLHRHRCLLEVDLVRHELRLALVTVDRVVRMLHRVLVQRLPLARDRLR